MDAAVKIETPLSNALFKLAIEKKIKIYQMYLEKGPTQMDADSMHHAMMERKLKNKNKCAS